VPFNNFDDDDDDHDTDDELIKKSVDVKFENPEFTYHEYNIIP